MKSLLKILESLLDDFQRLDPGVKGLHRDFVTIEARFKNEGYGFLTIALPAFGKAFDLGLEEGRLTCPLGFERTPTGSLPRFLVGLTRQVFDYSTGLLLEDASVHAVKCIRELLYLFKKLQLPNCQEKYLDLKAKTAFFTNDSQVLLEFSRASYYRHVCSFLLPHLDEVDLSECKHGPGAVSEGYTSNQKWQGVYDGLRDDDHRLYQYGISEAAFVAPDLHPDFGPSVRSPRDFARLVTVAKSSTSRRTITVEPMLNQFIQQGLNLTLRGEIRKDRVLRNCLALTDQCENQKLALVGSRTKEFATIDLSSASDLLSYSLVKETFHRHPRFSTLVDLCRTKFVKDGIVSSELRKFAGMGNALTFPVQSVVFAALAISAILWSKGLNPSMGNVIAISRKVRVYGDDIIVATESFDQVVNWLISFGLKVNQMKTYSKGFFRESCGVDAYRGYDVTPVYLQHQPDVTSMAPTALENLISVSNQCWLKVLYKFSDALRSNVEECVGIALPFIGRQASCLGWVTRREDVTFQRWNKHLHRFEVKGLCSATLSRVDKIDGYPALIKSLSTPLLGRSVGHLNKSHRRFTLRHRLRWVQAA